MAKAPTRTPPDVAVILPAAPVWLGEAAAEAAEAGLEVETTASLPAPERDGPEVMLALALREELALPVIDAVVELLILVRETEELAEADREADAEVVGTAAAMLADPPPMVFRV